MEKSRPEGAPDSAGACAGRIKKGDVEFLVFGNLASAGIARHCVSTRKGGVSAGPFASMNLGYGRGDDDANVGENFRRICRAAGLAGRGLVLSKQRHGANIRRVDEIGEVPDDTDGLMTSRPSIALVTFFADCVPLLFCDPVRRVVANSHAGWRGCALGMAARTVGEMAAHYGCNPADILAGIGPCISGANYEVGEDVAMRLGKEFAECVFPAEGSPGKFRAALPEICRLGLLRAGVPPGNIEIAGYCTYADEDLFFSHRRDGEERGSLAAFIALA